MRRVLMLAALVPFGFGTLRWITSGDDWRYLVVALGSTLGASVVRSGAIRSQPTALRWLASAGAATGGAAVTGFATGARNAVGLLVVAACFGICSATGLVAGTPDRV